MKLGISARRQSVLQLNDRSMLPPLLCVLCLPAASAKLAIVRNKFYQDLLMESECTATRFWRPLCRRRGINESFRRASQLMRALLLLKHFSFGSRVCSDVLQRRAWWS